MKLFHSGAVCTSTNLPHDTDISPLLEENLFWHTWEQLARHLNTQGLVKKRATEASFRDGNHQFRCPLNDVEVKVLCCVEAKPRAIDTSHVREVYMLPWQNYAIVHLFAWEQLLLKASQEPFDRPRCAWTTIDSVGPLSPLLLVTDYFWRRQCQFSCLPTLIVNEIRFLWKEAFGQAPKDRRSRRKDLCFILISYPHPPLTVDFP